MDYEGFIFNCLKKVVINASFVEKVMLLFKIYINVLGGDDFM